MLLIRVIDSRSDGLVSRRLVHNQSYEEVLHLGRLATPAEDPEAQDDEFDDDDDDDDAEADEDDDDAEADEDEVADDDGSEPVGSEDSPDGELNDHR